MYRFLLKGMLVVAFSLLSGAAIAQTAVFDDAGRIRSDDGAYEKCIGCALVLVQDSGKNRWFWMRTSCCVCEAYCDYSGACAEQPNSDCPEQGRKMVLDFTDGVVQPDVDCTQEPDDRFGQSGTLQICEEDGVEPVNVVADVRFIADGMFSLAPRKKKEGPLTASVTLKINLEYDNTNTAFELVFDEEFPVYINEDNTRMITTDDLEKPTADLYRIQVAPGGKKGRPKLQKVYLGKFNMPFSVEVDPTPY